MKAMIVGGDVETGKKSSIIDQLAKNLRLPVTLFNGELPDSITITGHDLVIWAPNISNKTPKYYLRKDVGAVLICSKVMRENRTEIDAVSRIFDMHANAVICVYKDQPERFRFKLIDALGNTWADTDLIPRLVEDILKFYEWSRGQIRISFARAPEVSLLFQENVEIRSRFITLNTLVADKVESNLGGRYFGNFSTRCMKMFPSARISSGFLFSPRNTDKRRLTGADFVLVIPPHYYGDRKPSVDAPTQVQIYNQFPEINFMIHGHATLRHKNGKEVITTDEYYPCGDLREVEEVATILRAGFIKVNLKNHGFLIVSATLDEMEEMISELDFLPDGRLMEDDG